MSAIELISSQQWFNSIDFGDYESVGREGPEFEYPNISLYSAMHLLNTIDFSGMRCLEIGPGSGLISIAMKKLGADYVAAVDGLDVPTFRAAVELSGQQVEYFTDGLEGIRKRTAWKDSFDFVFSAGLMYHLINPFLLIETSKNVLRDNGLFLLQSQTFPNIEYSGAYLNTRAHFNKDRTTFFMPSREVMRGLLTLGLFNRLGESVVVQQDNFLAILAQSVSSASRLQNINPFEVECLDMFEKNPDYPYGGYDFRDMVRAKEKSTISTTCGRDQGVSWTEIDLDKQDPPVFPYQPRPRR